MSSIDELGLLLIGIIDNMVRWGDPSIPDEMRRNKWQILAKRVMAASGEDLQQFIHNVVWDIASDKVIMSRELGERINSLIEKVGDRESELIRYVKRRAFPLVVRYMAISRQGGEE